MRDKNSFRKHCLQRLKRLKGIHKYKKDNMVLAKLYKYIDTHKSQNICVYLPLKMEVNLYPLIRYYRKKRKNIYVPFMENKSFRLVRYRLPLRKKQFGIKEPNDSKQVRTKKIDIAIVPIVGVDVTHRRVGFGQGMYDRFFAKELNNIDKVVFVARELCYSESIVTNDYDVKADMIITP